MKIVNIICQVLAALMALGAALIWWWSARIKTPEQFQIFVTVDQLNTGFGGGGNGTGTAVSPELNELAGALKRQSSLSGYAAMLTGLSALLQAIALGLSAVA